MNRKEKQAFSVLPRQRNDVCGVSYYSDDDEVLYCGEFALRTNIFALDARMNTHSTALPFSNEASEQDCGGTASYNAHSPQLRAGSNPSS